MATVTYDGDRPTTQSAADAIGPAFEHMKQVLFQPFNLKKWLVLGFIAFLAGVVGGGGGGGGGGNPGATGSGGPGGPNFGPIANWYQAHTAEFWLGAGVVALAGIIFVLIMLYVSSVFRFIFLDSVITGEPRVKEGWRENRSQGASYMLWRIAFGLGALLAVGIVVGIPGLIIYSAVAGGMDAGATVGLIFGIVLGVLMLLLCMLTLGIVDGIARDFVVPIMYLKRIGAMEAWRRVWPIVCGNKLGFVLYFLLKMACAMGAAIVSFFAVLLSLMVAAIPVALLGLLGWALVAALGITTWSWWYLAILIPTGIGVVLLFSYLVTCVLLPIPVYFQSYALKYLSYVEPEAATI